MQKKKKRAKNRKNKRNEGQEISRIGKQIADNRGFLIDGHIVGAYISFCSYLAKMVELGGSVCVFFFFYVTHKCDLFCWETAQARSQKAKQRVSLL